MAAIFAANLKKELFYTKARHYASSMEAHLSQNNIPTAVYDQLIEAVHDALPEMYRYVRLRRKMLSVEELHMYDVYPVNMHPFLLTKPWRLSAADWHPLVNLTFNC